MRYQAVLFDMDGTVLDTLGDLANACNHTLRAFGLPERTRTEIAHFLGNGAAWLISHAVPDGTGEARTQEILHAYQPWYDAHCDIETAPYPGIVELMQALKAAGVRQAVISNKQDSAVQLLAARYFPGLLDYAVGESATVRRKPNPDAVLAALAHMGLKKEAAAARVKKRTVNFSQSVSGCRQSPFLSSRAEAQPESRDLKHRRALLF